MSLTKATYSMLQDAPVNIVDYGADPSGIADSAAAIQAAVDAAAVSKKSVFFPAGVYIVNSTINSSGTSPLLIYGEGIQSSIIRWGLTTAGTLWNAGVQGLSAQNLQFSGSAEPASISTYYAGTIGIAATGVLELSEVRVTAFETHINWVGGYYHKFDNCIFDRANTVFLGGAFYNLHFSQSRFYRINDGIVYNGGAGPITFSQCAIETFKGTFCKATSGASAAVSFIGCYFENYPTTATVAPLPVGFYDDGVVVSGAETLFVSGCNATLKGIRRFLNNSGATTSNLVSVGNRFNYALGSQATCQYIYFQSTLTSGYFNDYADPNLVETTGSYTTDYFSGSLSNQSLVSGFDAITKAQISGQSTFTPTMTGSGGSAGTFAASIEGAYTRQGNQVTAWIRLTGITNLGSWSGDVRFALPFAGSSTVNNQIGQAAVRVYGTANAGYTARVDSSNSYLTILKYPGGAILSPESLQWSDLTTSASGRIFITITYLAD